MKGKGKGDRGNKLQDDCPLQFPNLKLVDHTRLCPRYTTVLGRSQDVDCVGLEEVDSLQTELETLLAAAAKRMRLLQAEIELLDEWLDKGGTSSSGNAGNSSGSGMAGNKDKPLTSSASSQPSAAQSFASGAEAAGQSGTPVSAGMQASGKRGSKGKSEDKPAKRMRTDSGRATYAQPSPTKSKGKVQHSKAPSDTSDSALPLESPRSSEPTPSTASSAGGQQTVRAVYKNLTPNRFWALVEPYCAEITPDDIRYLEEQIKACEDIGEYMKIPSLGRHYADKWAEEDMMAERDGGKIGDRRKSAATSAMSNGSNDASTLLKRGEDSLDDDTSPFGPLTQRLIQGLMEESMVTPLDDASVLSDADAVEAATVSPRSLAKQLHLGNTATLERRIKKELEDIGVLGADDDKVDESGAGEEEEDEILAELKKKQAELRALSHQNTVMLRFLHKQAKEELQNQELRKKMAAADAEVIEAYRKVQASKAKKKSPTKKEKEMFYRALKEREAIVKQLNRSETQ